MPRAALRPLPLLVAAALAACAHPHTTLSGEVKYGATAEEDLKAGEEELRDKNYPEAAKFFEHVRNKYPYSKLAAQAELRLADARFDNDKFVEAAEAYKTFVKMHPTHEQVDYASFRIGLSYLRHAPGDFILFPPAFEKDQAQLRTAIVHLEEFLRLYPQSKYAKEGQQALATAQGRLADHEWYVAGFYRKRGRWPAVAGRLEGVVREFPADRRTPEALLELGEAYAHLNERFKAQQALQRLITKYPEAAQRKEAEQRLAQLR
jgi:outer membrane protein assembly factor BamD